MILIRADANEVVGTGHVMRCLSIARAILNNGVKVKFVTADHRADSFIIRAGIDVICLESKFDEMDDELSRLMEIIDEERPEMLLVDSYYVTEVYFEALSATVKTAYMDDLNLSTWDVDYLINYNIFAAIYDYSGYQNKKTHLILGPQYVPLREDFANIPHREINDRVTSVLISAGGSDPEQVLERIIRDICFKWPEITFHCVVGALNPRIEKIKKLTSDHIVLHINEQNMAELMIKCDIAISAAGTTLYELCAVGLPTITYSLADNQIIATEQFETQGIMLNAGDCRNNIGFMSRMEELLIMLCNSRERRDTLSRRTQNLVDGKGTIRIAEILL